MSKHILITGSTDGIGKLASIALAKQGHSVYLHGRNAEKLEQVIAEVKAQSGHDNVGGFVADLSVLANVQTLVEQVNQTLPKLDVLINNAGVFKTNNATTQDGFDVRFVVNYFAPYVLSNGLIPLLEKADAPRVINLSSAAQAPVALNALSGQTKVDAQSAYAQSKLALTMWSFAFSASHPNINTIAVNPGSLLNTNMVKEAYGHHWSSADKGARVLCELAVSDAFAEDSGKYFDNDLSPKQGDELGDFNHAHPDAYDELKIAELIRTTERLIF